MKNQPQSIDFESQLRQFVPQQNAIDPRDVFFEAGRRAGRQETAKRHASIVSRGRSTGFVAAMLLSAMIAGPVGYQLGEHRALIPGRGTIPSQITITEATKSDPKTLEPTVLNPGESNSAALDSSTPTSSTDADDSVRKFNQDVASIDDNLLSPTADAARADAARADASALEAPSRLVAEQLVGWLTLEEHFAAAKLRRLSTEQWAASSVGSLSWHSAFDPSSTAPALTSQSSEVAAKTELRALTLGRMLDSQLQELTVYTETTR